MPTIFSHPAVALLKTFTRNVPKSAVAAGAIGSILPDADVASFYFGIPYGSTFGHRGFTHSIFFAAVLSAILTAAIRPRRWSTFGFIFVCTMSHPLLDACTNGGMGIAFFSPFSNHRYFFPWRPIEVSPIGAVDMDVLKSEFWWVWVPAIALATAGLIVTRVRER
ncbi:MAG TPA: metal-dependent hydrolase [Thermoanaerobaculia bacterium]|nr:metal-dependent hydrolase [Thermoanaerobaculia bacterium]